MLQKYVFPEGTVTFDDSRSVRELIAFAFEAFDYYEPLGMDIVTVFQCHHSKTSTGWFTTDVMLRCAEEIENPEELCFAYDLPDVFYYAEGGWGHHMMGLGNHPVLPDAVPLHIRFEDFNHTLVVNGRLCLQEIVAVFTKSGYIEDCRCIRVIPVGCAHKAYDIPLTDPIMSVPLSKLEEKLRAYHEKHIRLEQGEEICYEVLELC